LVKPRRPKSINRIGINHWVWQTVAIWSKRRVVVYLEERRAPKENGYQFKIHKFWWASLRNTGRCVYWNIRPCWFQLAPVFLSLAKRAARLSTGNHGLWIAERFCTSTFLFTTSEMALNLVLKPAWSKGQHHLLINIDDCNSIPDSTNCINCINRESTHILHPNHCMAD